MEPLLLERAGAAGPAGALILQPRPVPARATAIPADRLYRPALTLLLVVTLLLRLWGIKQGLPYSYNVDEATHFVPRAIDFFSHNLDPHYFLNPPAYSYVLSLALEGWFGSADAATRAYVTDPTAVFVVARVVAALLGTVAVWLTCLAGTRLFSRGVGLLAGAIFGLAFLPIFYSHLALNDVPALAPVALSLYGVAGVYRTGRPRDYLLTGLGIGLAAATKYTGGITLLCLLAAAGCDAGSGGREPAIAKLAGALLLALAAFTLANPYWIGDFSAFSAGLSQQASLAGGAEPVKLGTSPGGGIVYYLWTFTWGLGWVPALAALGGAGLLLARRFWGLAALFIPAPVAFVLFMGSQQRYFGRWLMPVFPLVALLGAWAAVELVRWAAARRLAPAVAGGALVTVALLVQSLVTVIHDDRVLSRPDTRNLTRAWMVRHVPAGSKIVIEPVVPAAWASDVGRSLPWTPKGQRWYLYPTWLSNIGARGRPLPDHRRRYVVVDEYERVLRPSLLSDYVQHAYCWVVIGSLQYGRAFSQPAQAPRAIAYYHALFRKGRLEYQASPYSPGSKATPFSFDYSIDYYPSSYRLPGPVMRVYHLRGGRCGG